MPQVVLIVGSKSDVPAAKGALEVLDRFGVSYEAHVCSAHRAPERLRELIHGAESQGTKCFIAGAGMAAALPGAFAAELAGVSLPSSLDPLNVFAAFVTTLILLTVVSDYATDKTRALPASLPRLAAFPKPAATEDSAHPLAA